MENSPSASPRSNAAAVDERRLCDLLRQNGIPFHKPNKHQIKVGPWSYYPSKGTILCDGRSKEKVRGPEAFIEILNRTSKRRLEWPSTIKL